MDHLKHQTDTPEQPEETSSRNGGSPRYTLPKGCKLGTMVGEGAANAVFEFQLPDGSYLYHQKTRTLPPAGSHYLMRAHEINRPQVFSFASRKSL